MKISTRTSLLGVLVDKVTKEEALEALFALSDDTQKNQSSCEIAITVNVDFMVNALRVFSNQPLNPELLKVMRLSKLVVADGMPLVLLSKIFGEKLPERVAGSDLIFDIAELAALKKKRLYFLGGTAESANNAAKILRAKYPNLEIVGIETPFIKLDDSEETKNFDKELCEKIMATKPDLLLVGLGNPKQELWVARNAKLLSGLISIGIGGSFNFVCGTVKRAPRWMQKSGLEWIFRIYQEPKRLFKRYFIGFFKFGMMSFLAITSRFFNLFGNNLKQEEFLATPCEFDTAQAIAILDCAKLQKVDNDALVKIASDYIESCKRGYIFQLVNVSKFRKYQLFCNKSLNF